jgi:hypothetical protein
MCRIEFRVTESKAQELVTEVGGTGDEKYRPRYEGNVKTDFE